MVKSFVLMLDLKCDDLIRQLFENIFEASNPMHPQRVEHYMLDILAACLEELARNGDEIPQPLIDAVLENLLEPKKSQRPAGYSLACALIQRCTGELRKPLHAFLEGCLPTSAFGCEAESDLKEEWQPLLLELAAISPETVMYLLPQLEEVAASEHEDARLSCTHLLADLFSLRECNLSRQILPLFETAFLGRMNDIAVPVRCAAVSRAIALVPNAPGFAERLVEALKLRVLDSSEAVRMEVVSSVCEASQEHLGAFCGLLPSIAYRMGDKKRAVQRAARDGLCGLYRKHMTAHLVTHPTTNTTPVDLRAVPQCLLSGSTDAESRIQLDLTMSKVFSLDEALRLRALCAFHHALEPKQRKTFRAMLREKCVLRKEAGRWLELQALAKSRFKNKVAQAKESQAKLVAVMCRRMPDPAKAREVRPVLNGRHFIQRQASSLAYPLPSSGRCGSNSGRLRIITSRSCCV